MDQTLQSIVAFRSRFGLPIPSEPFDLPDEEIIAYVEHMEEEQNELASALTQNDPIDKWAGIADSLCDNLTFFHHLVVKLGLHNALGDMFAEVDSSNHTKGEGNVLFDPRTGKMIKGAGYVRPNLHKFFTNELMVTTECISPVHHVEEIRKAQRSLVKTFLSGSDNWSMKGNLTNLVTELEISGPMVWFRARDLHGKFIILDGRENKIGEVTFDVPHCVEPSIKEVFINDGSVLVRPSTCLG